MKYLSLEEILVIYEYQAEKFGGKKGISDFRMLESAVLRPQATFDGKNLYSDVFEKAAALIVAIIKNHPFIDGNKRTAIHAGLTFLELNNVSTVYERNNLVNFALGIANNKIDVDEVAKMLKSKQ